MSAPHSKAPPLNSQFAQWRQFWFSDPGRAQQFLLLASLCFCSLFATQWFRLDKELAGAHRKVATGAEVAYVAPVAAMRMASLGNQGFAADLLFLRAAHYFVEHLVTDSRLPWLDLYLEAIWGLDANIAQSYRWGAQVIKFGQKIDQEVAVRANRFARLGLEYFPNDPWLYHEIAFNLRYSYQPRDPVDEKRLRGLALQYLETAYSFPSFAMDPNYLVGQYLRAGRDDDSVQAALETYAQATEEQRTNLRSLLNDRNRAALAGELAWLDQAHKRDFPWADPTLALFLGPKRVAAPPAQPAQPENWYREPAVPAELQKRLAMRSVVPLDGAGWRADEWAGRDLAALASPTLAR